MATLNNKPLTKAQIKSVSIASLEASKVVQKMTEPLRQANETLAKALNSGLSLQVKAIAEQFSKIPVPVFDNIFPQIELPAFDFPLLTPREITAPIKTRTDLFIDRQDQLLKALLELKVSNQTRESYKYYSETDTFIVNLHIPGAIYLGAKGGNNSMKILFEIFYEALEERGKNENGYKTVFVSVEEILSKALGKGKENADMNWLKHTRSNLVNTKIHDVLKFIVIISEYDKNKKGYYFKVRVDE